MLSALPTLQSRRFAPLLGLSILALVAMLALAGKASAAETLYWDNWDGDSLSSASTDGTGGGPLNVTGVQLEEPEGISIDVATGKLIVAAANGGPEGVGQLIAVNLDGTGAAALPTPGVHVENPGGIAVDPANETVYWINHEKGSSSVDWAKLDGTAAGRLNTAGALVEDPYRIAVDPSGGRVYWGNSYEPGERIASISYADVDNSGGGNLNITGATPGSDVSGIAVDPAAGRVYWLSDDERVSYANLNGSGGGDLSTNGAYFDAPYGLALDPGTGKFLWGNYSNGENREGALGFANLSGGGGKLNIASAPVAGPQDPVILKSPAGAGAPTVSRDAINPASLSCSNGSWVDSAGSFVYQAPRSYAYQWTDNGAAVAGATSNTLAATSPGSYACTVTGTNQLGSASQSSAAVSVAAATLKLSTKKKARVKAGKPATFKVTAANGGDLATAAGAKLCVKVPKKARKAVKAPKCKSVGGLAALGSRTLKLKLKTTKQAAGSYKVSFTVKGAAASGTKARVVVKAKKHGKHKKHKSKGGKKGK
jgi:hypothetical protein